MRLVQKAEEDFLTSHTICKWKFFSPGLTPCRQKNSFEAPSGDMIAAFASQPRHASSMAFVLLAASSTTQPAILQHLV